MALTVKGNEKVNGAAVNPLEAPKVYIGRRTGAVIKINARKDRDGFDRIEDYFPDSESEDEENKSSTDVKPIKLKPNQFIGRRTGALIEINARKDSHGFHLIEDYFPDSITESDISMASNKANKKSSMNKSTASKLEKTFESKEENREERAIENQDSEDQLIEPADKSHVASVSKEKKDIITPQEKEVEISPNLTGTAVKNSATSCEPTPQFFGSKKRLFPSTEIVDITRENKDETEEDIDIVGVGDEEEEGEKGTRVPPCNQAQTKNQAPAATQKEKETAKDDTFIVDVDGDESPCVFLENNSKRSNVKDAGNVQKEKEVSHVESKDDTLIVDIDDESTFLTLGNKSKDSKVKDLSHSDLVPEEEVSYQMDESVVLEGTKHKVMSPEFGVVSNHTLRSSGVEDDVVVEEEEVVKPKGRMARKSNKQTTKKGVKEQEGAEDKNDDQDDINFKQKSRKSTKSVQNKSGEREVDENQENVADVSVNVTDVDPVKKPTKKSKKSVPNKNSKEEKVEDEKEEDGADVSFTLSRLNQTTEDDKAVNPSKNGSKRPFKKSVPNQSSKEEQEDNEKQEDGADISFRLGQTTEDYKALKKGSRKTKKSISKRSLKEKQEEEKQEQEIQGQTKARQNTGDDKSDKNNTKRKSTRKTQTKQDGSPADASEEDLEHVVQGEAKASNKTEDDKSDKKSSKRKSTRKTRKEQDGDASEGEKEQPEERVMTRRATRSNTSKLASTTFNSLTDLTLNKTKTKKTEAPKTRSTRSKNKSMALEKEDGGSRESENEKNSTAGSHETLEDDDDENQIMASEREEDLPQEMETNDTAIHDTQLTKDGGCDDSTGEKSHENKSTSEICEPEVVDNDDDDLDGDDEKSHESQEISKKPRKNGQKSNGRKSKGKGRRLTASTNQSASDSSHNDEGGDDDEDDDDDNDEDGEEGDGNENTKNDSRNISKNGKNKYKGSKKSIASNSASDIDKGRVNKRGRPRKTKHRSQGRLTLARPMARKSCHRPGGYEIDVTDQEGTADEDDITTKAKKKQPEDVALENVETVNKSINKSSRKRTNGTRVDSLRIPESSTPASNNDSPNVLPPSSVKSILKSSITRTQSADAKKRRVSIAGNRKGSDAANDDGNSGNPNRCRKSSVSFAPTPSFRISPDDFSTPEESPSKLAKLSFVTNYSGFTSEDNTFTPGDVPSASLSSSVSSVGSNSISGSDSCVNNSQEITISSAKRRQIADNEGKDDSDVRRSKRTKVPALQYWKNERIKYERRQSGWFVSGIEKVPTPKVVKQKPSKKPKKEKKRGTTYNEYQEEDSEDFIDVPADMADMKEVTYTGIPVVNPDTGEQVELDLVHTPEMLNFVNTLRKPAQTDDSLIMDKYMSHNLFGAGQIVLRPGAEKGKQHVRDDTMVFYVVKGQLEVTVHESTVFLRTGSTFFVPTGNWYNIKNADCKDARLLFVQIKG